MSVLIVEKTLDKAYYERCYKKLVKNLYPENVWQQLLSATTATEEVEAYYVVNDEEATLACAIVYSDGKISNTHEKTFFVGGFECVQDLSVAQQLFDTIKSYCALKSVKHLIGPLNGTTWNSYRFNNDDKQPFFLSEVYHCAYYIDFFKAVGFEVIANYYSSIDTTLYYDETNKAQFSAFLEKEGVTVRTLCESDCKNDLEKIFPLITKSFADNFLYTPISLEQFVDKYMHVLSRLTKEYVLLAEDKDGTCIGFIFCFPDLNNPSSKTIVLKTIGRALDPKWKGIGGFLMTEVIDKMKQNGFSKMIHAYMMKDGASTYLSTNFNSSVYREYSLFGLKI